MKKKNKIRVFLTFLVCIILLSHGLAFVNGYSNTTIRSVDLYMSRGGKYQTKSEAGDFTDYKFGDHYSTHDWVADSALRLILNSENPDHIKYVNWLFRDSDQISYKDFDDKSGWWMKNSANFDFTDEQRQRVEAYMFFLYGTKMPDYDTHLIVNSEKITSRRKPAALGWGSKSLLHHIYYEFDTEILDYRLIDPSGMSQANLAANDAYAYLTGQHKNPNDGQVKYRGAAACLGGMVHFIGDLAHPAHVMPTKNSAQWTNGQQYPAGVVQADMHGYIDRYIAIAGSTVMTPNPKNEKDLDGRHWPLLAAYASNEPSPLDGSGPYYTGAAEWAGEEVWPTSGPKSKSVNSLFTMGGPDWSVIDVRDLKIGPNNDRLATDEDNFTVSGLTPMPASVAVYKMAKLTLSGWDEPNGADEYKSWGSYHISKSYRGPNSVYHLATLHYGIDSQHAKSFIDVTNPQKPDTLLEACQNTQARTKVLMKWASYYSACAILDVVERAWKKNNNDWPDPEEVPPPTIEYREMLSMEEVNAIWNEEHQGDEILLPQSQATKGSATASVGAMTMLAIPLLSIFTLGIVIPMIAKKERDLEAEQAITVKN